MFLGTSPIVLPRVQVGMHFDTTIWLRSVGTDTLDILRYFIFGADSVHFDAELTHVRLAPGDSAALSIRFAPLSIGDKEVQLEIAATEDAWLGTIRAIGIDTIRRGVEDRSLAPSASAIDIFPQPSAGATNIFVRSIHQPRRAEILDVLGRRIGLATEFSASGGGAWGARFDASTLASGRYMVRVAGEFSPPVSPLSVLH
jgi:hypothetical protein